MTLLEIGDNAMKRRGMRVTRASLSMLERSGVKFEEITDGHFHVAGGFCFWPSVGYWRSHDGKAKGYGAGGLIALSKAMTKTGG